MFTVEIKCCVIWFKTVVEDYSTIEEVILPLIVDKSKGESKWSIVHTT